MPQQNQENINKKKNADKSDEKNTGTSVNWTAKMCELKTNSIYKIRKENLIHMKERNKLFLWGHLEDRYCNLRKFDSIDWI